MVCSISYLTTITSTVSRFVKLPNGQFARVTHIETVKISALLTLTNVLCVPSFSFNLISASQLTKLFSCCLIFLVDFCFIQHLLTWRMIGVGKECGGLLHLLNKPALPPSTSPFPAQSASVKSVFSDVWHYRLGHLSNSRLQLLSQYDSSISVDMNKCCTICPLAKQHRLPFPVSQSFSNKAFDLIHCDIWGPFSTDSLNGIKYFLTIVDDFSRFTWIHLMTNKFESKVKCLRSDNGFEFQMSDFFQSKGIVHQLSCVETPQQNSVVERKHQHLLNVARALRFQANLPLFLWGECIFYAAHLINRTPTPILSHKTPFECLFSVPPTFYHLRVVGCLCFVSTLTRNRSKLDPRAKPCIFIGYPYNVKGYKLFDPFTNTIMLSFMKMCFLFILNFIHFFLFFTTLLFLIQFQILMSLYLIFHLIRFSILILFHILCHLIQILYQPIQILCHLIQILYLPLFLILPYLLIHILLLLLLVFLVNSNLFDNLPGFNRNLVTYMIFIVKWHLLHLMFLVILLLFQISLMLSHMYFHIKNCLFLINILFYQFLPMRNHNFFTKLYNMLAGVRQCRMRSRHLKRTILGLLCLYLPTKFL